mmetsp:Transcript_78325/g.179210  ORF Transcript_78325/g.179210 Transcript_78325/m.179210 type:complete len:269 (+) Transcript_78325:2-808(+)
MLAWTAPRKLPRSCRGFASDNRLLLGLAITQPCIGYAALRFDTLEPVKIGLIDLVGLDAAAKKTEALSALKSLRKQNSGATWVVGIKQMARVGHKGSQYFKTADLIRLNGVLADQAERIFKTQPYDVHMRHVQSHLGIQAQSWASRRAMFDFVVAKVPAFPVVKTHNNALADESLNMTDAWGCAAFAKRRRRVEEMRGDEAAVASIKSQVLKHRTLRELEHHAKELREEGKLRESKEVHDVWARRVQQEVDKKLFSLLDQEQERNQMT